MEKRLLGRVTHTLQKREKKRLLLAAGSRGTEK
jgi:hypothetical protein